jgi:ADP-ribose pyrophosphatase
MNTYEKTLSTNSIFKGKIINVELQDVLLPNGKTAKREIVRHCGGASVVPISEQGEIYLVRQFRKPYDEETLEIPAGKVDIGEKPLECAIRELKEETGLSSENIIHLTDMYPSPGFTDEIIHIYAATDVKVGNSKTDEDEFLSVEKYHITKIYEMIKSGKIKDSKTIVGVLFAEKILNGLF